MPKYTEKIIFVSKLRCARIKDGIKVSRFKLHFNLKMARSTGINVSINFRAVTGNYRWPSLYMGGSVPRTATDAWIHGFRTPQNVIGVKLQLWLEGVLKPRKVIRDQLWHLQGSECCLDPFKDNFHMVKLHTTSLSFIKMQQELSSSHVWEVFK